ncbi:MAG: phytanoyl-CoA dioxygenase family protein [Candidatus Latescibacterota bacterium]|nr:phytanoyl-CoA dioxygenase family protein [Candidatus Latescibacterota bacterium]
MKSRPESLFRLSGPSPADIDSFHSDGYIVYPDVFTDEARESIIEEIARLEPVSEYIRGLDGQGDGATAYFARPWNDRGPGGDRLIDDPFISTLLQTTIDNDFHFCHSALNLAPRGAAEIPYHQDHHHWKHDNPVNLAERGRYYIQVLYYLNGFTLGDRNLKVIAGSHRVAPTQEATPERMLAGEFDAEVGRTLEETRLALPPGSMVYINARIFHAVEEKPADSPQPYRIFNIDIFKEVGPPHRFTQEIPAAWMERAGPERRKLFTREAYLEGCWDQ